MSISVLIVSSEPTHWAQLSKLVVNCGLNPVRCDTLAVAAERAAQQRFDLAICSEDLPDGNFRQFIVELRRLGRKTPVVVVSRFDDWGAYLQAMMAGAFDYVAFPPYPHELERAVAAALTEEGQRRNGTAAA